MKAPFRRTQAPSVEQPTVVAPSIDPTAPPAPAAPDGAPLDPPAPMPAATAPAVGNRGKLRRRMRYLRRAHELGLRDLGGLVFDLHRFGRRNDQLVVGKLQALETVDAELRAIERVLGAHRDVLELREPGITACVRCGALHGTDARFCPSCGTQVDGLVAVGGAHAVPAPAPVAAAAVSSPAPPAPAPPVPASGPAPSAPPLWSVPQPTAEHARSDEATSTPTPPPAEPAP